MNGLSKASQKRDNGATLLERPPEAAIEGRGVKRKFELDEEEMLKNAQEERVKARRALDEEKVGFALASGYYNIFFTNLHESPRKQGFHPSGYRP